MSKYSLRKYEVSIPDEGDWYIACGPYYFLGNYSSKLRALRALAEIQDYEVQDMTPEEIYPLVGIGEGFEAEEFPGYEPWTSMEQFRREVS